MADEPHPEVQRVIDLLESMDLPETHELSPAEAREQFEMVSTQGEPAVEVGAVDERTIPGPDGDLRARVYTPEGEGPHPVVVYFHGGGFVLGSPETHDDLTRALCDRAGRVVVSVDYRLAPEHPFPAAVEDAYAATAWVAEQTAELGGTDRVAVAGDSAGGTLAAVTALLARDRGRDDRADRFESPHGPPAIERQVLLYPATSYGRAWPSYGGEEYLLTMADMEYFGGHYLEHPLHGYNRYAYPLDARDLSGLPAATVVTAGFDPLADEGRAYADRMAEAGVDVTHREYEAMVHGFLGMLTEPSVSSAWDAVEDVAADLQA